MSPKVVDAETARAFIRANTAIASPELLPELRLHLATEITPIWEATEAMLEAANVPPPYWAFAWSGGQALARHLLDRPELVRGRHAVDFGAGSGMLAIVAARGGARTVRAAEIDPVAIAAIGLNAELNGVAVEAEADDIIGTDPRADLILVGDLCYEKPLAERLVTWLRGLAGRGVEVLLGDPGRTYVPTSGLVEVARYSVPTSTELEDRPVREGVVWRLMPQ